MPLFARWLLIGWFCGVATAALCAVPTLPFSRNAAPMAFMTVRSAEPGCEPDCPEWISAQGDIVPGTASAFERFIDGQRGRQLPIVLSSLGGSVSDAIAIGRIIRARRYITEVAHTTLAPCPPTSPAGCDQPRGIAFTVPGSCASACTLILAGGVQRYANPEARIGVHQSLTVINPRNGSQSAKVEADVPATEAQMANYFREMGMSPQLMALVEATPPSQLHWLTAEEKRSTGIVTSWISELTAFSRPDGAGPLDPPSSTEPAASAKIEPSPGPALVELGEKPFALPVNARNLVLRLELAYRRDEKSITATLETHFRDASLEKLFTPEVRGRGFDLRFEPRGYAYHVAKSFSGDPPSVSVLLSDVCGLTASGRIVVEPFDGPQTNIIESMATANPHQPPIAFDPSSMDGMSALLKDACPDAIGGVIAKP